MPYRSNQQQPTITFVVEELNPEKTFGATSSHIMISENLNKVKIKGLGQANDFSAFVFQAGRYLAVVANDAENKMFMSFFDLKNNEQMAKMIATQFEESLRRVFMKNFYELSKSYKQSYNLVSLVAAPGLSSKVAAN